MKQYPNVFPRVFSAMHCSRHLADIPIMYLTKTCVLISKHVRAGLLRIDGRQNRAISVAAI